MGAFVGILGIVVCVIWIFAAGASQAKRVIEVLAAVASKLDRGRHDTKQRIATGEVDGVDVAFRYVVRGSGKHAQQWTEIEVAVPPQYPLRLFIRKHGWLDSGKIERGDMVDVVVGDRPFDDAFLVEAAPADVARILLDERERDYLLELAQRQWLEVTTERGEIRLSVRSWMVDLPDITRGIEAMVAIGGRLREAYATVARATPVEDAGTPYRPMLDDRAAKSAADARLEEVKRVDVVQTRRKAREQTVAVSIILVFVFLALMIVAASH